MPDIARLRGLQKSYMEVSHMKRVLENDFLKVTIDDHGAELVSIYDKEKEHEVIWQGDPAFWGRHAPVLFPNVGKHLSELLPYRR